MKVDYLSIHFKTFMIPSRTKLESFNSFGSHVQLLQLFMANFHIFFECNEPILSSLFIFQKKVSLIKKKKKKRPEYSEDSSDQTKTKK